jgi:potassium/chloride transporter 8
LQRGPNKEPVAGVILVFVIAVLFLLVGHVNALSPIVVMPFLLTYAAINYAYFALAMSPREGRCAYERLVNEEVTNEVLEEDSEQSVNTDQMEEEPMELADSQEICYGYQSTTITEQLPHTTSLIVAEDENMRQMRSHATQSRAKEVTPPIGHPDTRIKLFPKSGIGVYRQPNSLTGLFQSCDDSTSIHSKVNSEPNDQVSCHWTHRLKFWKRTRQKGDDEPVVSSKISRVVSRLVNRWISLAGALISVLIMFLIHWGYALASLTAGCLLYIYIAKASQGLPPGIADFSLTEWIKSLIARLRSKSKPVHQPVVFPPSSLPIPVSVHQLTYDSADYQDREKRHRSVRTSGMTTHPTTAIVTPLVSHKVSNGNR